MDNRPIGVFDSGIGGLPVLYKLMKAFPSEDFIYLGDNRNVPYGDKSFSFVRARVKHNIEELVSLGAKFIVSACNTASACLSAEARGFEEEWRLPGDCEIFKIGINNNNVKLFFGKGAFLATPFTVGEVKKIPLSAEKFDFYPLASLAGKIENDPFSDDKEFIKEFKEKFLIDFFCDKTGVARENVPTNGLLSNAAREKSVFRDHVEVFRDHFEQIVPKYDFLYLGCTHYLYKEEALKSVFGGIKCVDGTDNLIKNINTYIEKHGIFGENFQTIDFVGDCAKTNASVFEKYVGKKASR